MAQAPRCSCGHDLNHHAAPTENAPRTGTCYGEQRCTLPKALYNEDAAARGLIPGRCECKAYDGPPSEGEDREQPDATQEVPLQ